MPHKEGHKETRAEKNLRQAKEITEKTAAKKPKQEAQVAAEEQKAIIKSENYLDWLAEKRAEAAEKRDESKMGWLKNIVSFGTAGLAGGAAGWYKKEKRAQEEYEQTLKDISGERGRMAADAAKKSKTTRAVSQSVTDGRNNKIHSSISKFGRLSPAAQQEAIKGIGFTTAQVPKEPKHPDDYLPPETETQYTGPKGIVFTDPKKAIRSRIAAERIKGTKKKQWAIQQQEAAQALSDFDVDVTALSKADQKAQAAIDEEARHNLSVKRADLQRGKIRKIVEGTAKKGELSALLRETFADAGNSGMPFDVVMKNAKGLYGEGDLPVGYKALRGYYETGARRGAAKTEAERIRVMSNLGLVGGSPSPESHPWAYDEDEGLIDKYGTANKNSLANYKGGVDARIALDNRIRGIARTAERDDWDAASDERLKALEVETLLELDAKMGDIDDITELPLTPIRGQSLADEPFPVDPKLSEGRHHRPALKGWVDGEGGRVLSPEAKGILYRGRKELLLAKVEDIVRLTGKLPPITSAPDIERRHSEALARASTEAKSLVAMSLNPNTVHKGSGAWEKSIKFVRDSVDRGDEASEAIATIAESMLQSQRVSMLLKDAPEEARVNAALWRKALAGHSPLAEHWKPHGADEALVADIRIPTIMVGGVEQPKYAIIVGQHENSDGDIVPIVRAVNNPDAALTDNDKARRDNQVKTKQAQENAFMKTQGVTNLRVLGQDFKVKENK